MRLGVCYYPEQWPADRWPVDAQAMAAAGLELVRIGEFAWSSYEPARDRFDWGWLDRAIDTLAQAGLRVVLGTSTATPPVWLALERPEILSVGPDGRRRAYGSRRHTCPTSPAYRGEAQRVVAALVGRYGRHEAIVAWQVDNEPGNHDSARCWCDACQQAFTGWLTARYGSIAALNAAWGTAFWSQTYPSFEAVRLPVPTMTAHNPGLLLAHRRFASDTVVAGLAEQRAVIAEGAPGRDIFTNLYAGDTEVDPRAVADGTGIAAVDSYPHDTSGPLEVAYALGRARGRDRLWVTEQQPGQVNWTPGNPPVPPGQVRLWCWQAALHGAEALLLFRWRAARYGQEQEHAGLLRHDGSPDRALAEVSQFAGELRAADPALLQRPPAPVALLCAADDAWAIAIDPHYALDPYARGLSHRDLHLPAYVAARRLGLEVDVIPPEEDLRGYEVVLAPALHLATAARLERLEQALDAGALVVLGPRSLVKDAEGARAGEPLPAGLHARLGARVAEQVTAAVWPPDAPATLTLAAYGTGAGPWAEALEVTHPDTEVLAGFAGRHLDGVPAIVRRGSLVYAGCSSADAWSALLAHLLGRSPQPAHVERFERGHARVRLDHARLTVEGLRFHNFRTAS